MDSSFQCIVILYYYINYDSIWPDLSEIRFFDDSAQGIWLQVSNTINTIALSLFPCLPVCLSISVQFHSSTSSFGRLVCFWCLVEECLHWLTQKWISGVSFVRIRSVPEDLVWLQNVAIYFTTIASLIGSIRAGPVHLAGLFATRQTYFVFISRVSRIRVWPELYKLLSRGSIHC